MTCSKHEPLSPQNEEGITEVKWIDINEMDEVLSNTYPSLLDMLSKYQKKKE
ncbi:MAG: hypothetical protein WCL06_07295 [Bacteroidota bacterium]